MNKAIFFLFIISFSISCSSDDDSQNSNNTDNAQQLILGTWNLSSLSRNGENLPQSVCDQQETYSFDSSGNYTEIYYLNEIEPCGDSFESGGVYSLDGDNVTFTIGNDTFTKIIQNISSNQLVLREVYTDNGTTLEFIEFYEK